MRNKIICDFEFIKPGLAFWDINGMLNLDKNKKAAEAAEFKFMNC